MKRLLLPNGPGGFFRPLRTFGLLAMLCLLTSLSASAQDTDENSDVYLKILDMRYDYAFRPGNDVMEPDIIGKLYLTVKCNGLQMFYTSFSECHYSSPDEAPMHHRPMPHYVNANAETETVVFGLFVWGAWAQLSYVSPATNETVYLPKIWSTDLIDAETLNRLAGISEVVASDNKLNLSVSNRQLLISSSSATTSTVEIYNLQGASAMRTMANGQETSVSLDQLSAGVYVARVSNEFDSATLRFSLR